jgi:hypothetical protein
MKYGIIAKRTFNPFQLTGNRFSRLIPRDALKFTLPSFTDALHGIFKPVWCIHSLSVGTSARTGPELRLITIISFNPGNYSVFDMHLKQTPPSAVMSAGGNHCFFFRHASLQDLYCNKIACYPISIT